MRKNDLYKVLSDGEWHSGQELASSFGVSRTVIWKQIARLRENGMLVEASQGKGYRLAAASPVLFLREALLENILPQAGSRLNEIVLLDTTSSTNEVCMQRLAEFPDNSSVNGILVVAERQTSGRGRRGRGWVSPYAASLYMSLTERFDSGAAALSGLSLVVGLAVANVLRREACSEDIQLKWPNDIYFSKKKLGGILLEVVGDVDGPCHAVIGIGLNIHVPLESAEKIDQPFTTLSEAYPDISWDKNNLAALIVNELYDLIPEFKQQGFSPFRERWRAIDCFMGEQVIVHGNSDVASGRCVDVAADGSLLLETAEGLQTVIGGEVSLRPTHPSRHT